MILCVFLQRPKLRIYSLRISRGDESAGAALANNTIIAHLLEPPRNSLSRVAISLRRAPDVAALHLG